MKAVVYFGKHQVDVTDFPEPPLEEYGVKIRVKYCGLCGTDLHKYEGNGGSRPVVPPVVLGHEISGIVEEVGKKVTRFQRGDRVTADPNWYCKRCDFCQKGAPNLCSHNQGVVKGFAEFICPPEENVYSIPDTLSLRDAALSEPVSCCLHGLDLLDAQIGETAAVIGLGSIGSIMTVLLSRLTSSKVLVFDSDPSKEALAKQLGAAAFIPVLPNLNTQSLPHIDRVIECVGLQSTAEMAFHIAGKGAVIVLFGVGAKNSYAKLPLYETFQKELTIKASYLNFGTMQRAIALLDSGVLPADLLISAELPLSQIPEELASRKNLKKGKVIARL